MVPWISTCPNVISDVAGTYCTSVNCMYLAISNKACGIDIYASTVEGDKMELVLTLDGHRAVPSCLRFSYKAEPLELVSAAKDYIIRWNITECLINQHNGLQVKGSVMQQSPADEVTCIAWGHEQDMLAFCAGINIFVLAKNTHHELQAHTDVVCCAEFCPHYESTLVTASVDRSYMIWNTETAELLYRSSIISSSPFALLLMDRSREEFILASHDGMVRFYDISSDSDFSQRTSIDIEKVLTSNYSGEHSEPASHSSSIVALELICLPLDNTDEMDTSLTTNTFRSLFHTVDLLLVLTTSHVLLFNTRTCDVISIYSLSDSGIGCIFSASLQLCEAEIDESEGHLKCVSEDLIGRKLRLSSFNLVAAYMASQEVKEGRLSIVAMIPVQTGSPLHSSLLPKVPPSKVKSVNRKPKQTQKGVKDQPLVYHTKVRSSGYASTQAKVKMFQPRTANKQSVSFKSNKSGQLKKSYPSHAGPIQKLKGEIITADTRLTQILGMDFSTDGQNLSVSCANSQVYSFKLPLSHKKCTAYSGHTGAVHSCKWSFLSRYMLTASSSVVNLWSKDYENPMLVINRLHGNMSDSSGAQAIQSLPGEVKHAQFYYLDKFILMSSGNHLLLYKYYIDTSKSDLKRYENGSKYKLVTQLSMESAQTVTSFYAVNTFYSHLVLAAGSDKSVQVFDMNRGCHSRIIEQSHVKPAHHITINEGSVYSSLPHCAYDMFMTSAINDGVKLWDLRTQRSVRKLEAHSSKALPCSCHFSPDGQYVAVGSEDRYVYIYDVGTGDVVSRLKGMSDACTQVLYHPLHAQLAVGSIQGSLAMYEG